VIGHHCTGQHSKVTSLWCSTCARMGLTRRRGIGWAGQDTTALGSTIWFRRYGAVLAQAKGISTYAAKVKAKARKAPPCGIPHAGGKTAVEGCRGRGRKMESQKQIGAVCQCCD